MRNPISNVIAIDTNLRYHLEVASFKSFPIDGAVGKLSEASPLVS